MTVPTASILLTIFLITFNFCVVIISIINIYSLYFKKEQELDLEKGENQNCEKEEKESGQEGKETDQNLEEETEWRKLEKANPLNSALINFFLINVPSLVIINLIYPFFAIGILYSVLAILVSVLIGGFLISALKNYHAINTGEPLKRSEIQIAKDDIKAEISDIVDRYFNKINHVAEEKFKNRITWIKEQFTERREKIIELMPNNKAIIENLNQKENEQLKIETERYEEFLFRFTNLRAEYQPKMLNVMDPSETTVIMNEFTVTMDELTVKFYNLLREYENNNSLFPIHMM